MSPRSKIDSAKILVKDIFNMWFTIPEYQRPYAWGEDNVFALLNDICDAMKEDAASEYFLGSFVYQHVPAPKEHQAANICEENFILDGQQRLTTLFLIFAVLRDLSNDEKTKSSCEKRINQIGDEHDGTPHRIRITYSIRKEVMEFLNTYVIKRGCTDNENDFNKFAVDSDDASIRKMSEALLAIRKYFCDWPADKISLFLKYLLQNVLMISVSTENLDDAFRLFSVLNDRGVPLRTSDILKAKNLAHTKPELRTEYAEMWENAEGELKDDFDRFLGYIRTVLVKDRARGTLLQEFEEKIYATKSNESGRKPLLELGVSFFQFFSKHLTYYQQLLSLKNDKEMGSCEFDNTIKIMLEGLDSRNWIPPLLAYFDKFKYEGLLDFLRKLNNKFSADWINRVMPSPRIDAINSIIKAIDKCNSCKELLTDPSLHFEQKELEDTFSKDIYQCKFCKYILLRLEYFYGNPKDVLFGYKTLSIEHVMPQNPKADSQWVKDFTQEEREFWTHKLANLVLITRRKNSAQGNRDYTDKCSLYFEGNIDTCPNSLRVLRHNKKWTPSELATNQTEVITALKKSYGMN